MCETLVNVDELIDIALAKPRTGVLDLSALRSLLHIIVRKLNLENLKVEIPDASEHIQCILESTSPLAISEYNAGKLVPRSSSFKDDGSVIKIKHLRLFSDLIEDEQGVVSNILYEIFTRSFVADRRTSPTSSKMLEVVDRDRYALLHRQASRPSKVSPPDCVFVPPPDTNDCEPQPRPTNGILSDIVQNVAGNDASDVLEDRDTFAQPCSDTTQPRPTKGILSDIVENVAGSDGSDALEDGIAQTDAHIPKTESPQSTTENDELVLPDKSISKDVLPELMEDEDGKLRDRNTSQISHHILFDLVQHIVVGSNRVEQPEGHNRRQNSVASNNDGSDARMQDTRTPPPKAADTIKSDFVENNGLGPLLDRETERLSQIIVSDIVDDVFGSADRPLDETALQIFQVVAGEMVVSVMGLVITNPETEIPCSCESIASDYFDGIEPLSPAENRPKPAVDPQQESNINSDQKTKEGAELKSKVQNDSRMVSSVDDVSSKPSKNNLFHQFEQLIKHLDKTGGTENSLEFKNFLQKLFDEIQIKIANYLQKVDEKRMYPTANELQNHVETQVSNTLLHSMQRGVSSSTLSRKATSADSFLDIHERRPSRIRTVDKPAKTPRESETVSKRFCGGEHTRLLLSDRPKLRTTVSEKCCNHPKCNCHRNKKPSAIYGSEMI